MEKTYHREVSAMIVLDANYILRYLLNDHHEMFITSKECIENNDCFLLNEVVAEVVYVLSGVYKVPKEMIVKTLSGFVMLENITMHEAKHYLLHALELYETKNLDFVDCCLCALREKYTIKTFDKKLIKCISA